MKSANWTPLGLRTGGITAMSDNQDGPAAKLQGLILEGGWRVLKLIASASDSPAWIDGDFRPRTLRAVSAFQSYVFGPSGDDGIIGPVTAPALGITWPS